MEALARKAGRNVTAGNGQTRRIVVTGPESTGKTTLAAQLAERLGAPLVAEAAREYAERVARPLTATDVEPIARRAVALDDAARAGHPPVIVLDTDLVSTVVYARHYYGACPEWIVAAAHERRGDVYLLCDNDLPWVGDGVRDRPEARTELHALFSATLTAFGCMVVRVAHETVGTADAAGG